MSDLIKALNDYLIDRECADWDQIESSALKLETALIEYIEKLIDLKVGK